MGDEVSKDHFNARDYRRFNDRLDQEMALVRQLFQDQQFDNQTRKLGYELELCLVDQNGHPAPLNERILDGAANKAFTYELAKYNLEINGNAFELSADVFNEISNDLEELYREIDNQCQANNIQPGLFGVLPSLGNEHLDPDHYMSNMYRYRILDQCLMAMRKRPIHLELHGQDCLMVERTDVMLEAMGTSLQVHYQVPFDESVASYHASLWACLPMIAVATNSPLVLQKLCWQESRIAIFKQSVDTRNLEEMRDAVVPRVHLSKGYINSWLDLFEDNSYYTPILPEVIDCEPAELHHFNLHNGTIWRWVRPILGVDADGSYHLRLELRVAPSGPTRIDTVANLVFCIGLIEGLKTDSEHLTVIPYASLEQDFYRAARTGLDADITWYDGRKTCIKKMILDNALDQAKSGLARLGVESEPWLGIIEQRVISGRTGAYWIKNYWNEKADSEQLVLDYLELARNNLPVHEWPLKSSA